MLASEKMAKRAVLFNRLVKVDHELKIIFGKEPSNRVTAVARGLLENRVKICHAMTTVGFAPWDIPADIEETKVSSG